MTLPHIATRILGTPLLIHGAKLDVILSAIGQRIGLDVSALPQPQAAVRTTSAPQQTPGIAVIPIYGSLLKRAMPVEAASGLLAYDDIAAMLDIALADPAVSAIVLDIDSPGGEVGGCFELAARIRQMAAVKPIWAVANDSAFSAAYALACACERVFVTQTGGVGSVGVIAVHVDQSAADAQAGMHYTPIYAGARKNDYSPHAPLDDMARAALQAEVDRLYDIFVGHVAAMRGLSAQAVRATQAALFFGPQAVAAGLADAVAELPQVLQQLTGFLSSQGRLRGAAQARALAHRASSLELAMQQDEQPDPIAEAVAAERQRAVAIFDLCALAGTPDLAAGLIAGGKSLSDVSAALLAVKAGRQAPEIASHVDPDQAATVQPQSRAVLDAVRKLFPKE